LLVNPANIAHQVGQFPFERGFDSHKESTALGFREGSTEELFDLTQLCPVMSFGVMKNRLGVMIRVDSVEFE
jgi:hypothetical protein